MYTYSYSKYYTYILDIYPILYINNIHTNIYIQYPNVREILALWYYRAMKAFLQEHRNGKDGKNNLAREQMLASTHSGTLFLP